MTNQASCFRVGLAVVMGTVAIVASLIYLGGFKSEKGEVLAETYYDKPVSGLSVGSPVNFRGVKVGSVKKISFVGSEYKVDSIAEEQMIYVLIAFDRKQIETDDEGEIERYFSSMLDRGLRATVTASGITGLSRIELNFAGEDAPPPPKRTWMPRHKCIPPGVSLLDNVSDSASAFIGKLAKVDVVKITSDANDAIVAAKDMFSGINTLATNVNEVVSGYKSRLDKIADNVEKLTAAATAAIETNSPLVATTVTNLNETILTTRATVAKAGETLAEADRILTSVGSLASSAEKLIGNNSAEVMNLMKNLGEASAAAEELLKKLKDDPSLLIRGIDDEPLSETK